MFVWLLLYRAEQRKEDLGLLGKLYGHNTLGQGLVQARVSQGSRRERGPCAILYWVPWLQNYEIRDNTEMRNPHYSHVERKNAEEGP